MWVRAYDEMSRLNQQVSPTIEFLKYIENNKNQVTNLSLTLALEI